MKRFSRRLSIRRAGLGAVLLALPIAVSVEVPEDSSLTQLRVAGGAGSYLAVMRDCDGNVISESKDTFADVAFGVDHKFGDPVSLGASGGFLHDGRFPSGEGYYYVNPTMGLAWQRFGLSLGAVWFSKELLDPDDVDPPLSDDPIWLPSFAMRIGHAHGPYFSTALFSSFPMYSDGGYLDLGIGGGNPRVSGWGGLSLGGPTATALAGRLEWRLTDRFYLNLGATLGSREGELQGGGNVGLTYRVIH